jgi:hypothetical protein
MPFDDPRNAEVLRRGLETEAAAAGKRLQAQPMTEYVDTKTVLAVAWRNFGNHAFRVDPKGRFFGPLRKAQYQGLCQFIGPDRVVLTRKGAEKAVRAAATLPGGLA